MCVMARRLFAPRRRRHAGCLTVFLLLFAAAALVLSLNGLSNRYVRLETRPVTVLQLPRALENTAILHISDLHAAQLGPGQTHLRQALGKESYQAVALTGDIVGRSGNVKPLLELLDALKPGVPVFFVAGDNDPAPLMTAPHGDGEVKAPWVREAEARGARYLEYPVRLEVEGQAVWFVPGELYFIDLNSASAALKEQAEALKASGKAYEPETGAQLRAAEHRLGTVNAALQAMEEIQPTDLVVALTHQPPGADMLGELAQEAREKNLASPGLFLGGQFNNGQARLPGLGPVYVPPQADGRGGFFPGDEGFTGLSIQKGFPVHISPGLGVSGYYPVPLRLFNRPSVTLLQLTARMTR